MIAVRLPAAMASRTSGQVRSSIQTLGVWLCAGNATSSNASSRNIRFIKASLRWPARARLCLPRSSRARRTNIAASAATECINPPLSRRKSGCRSRRDRVAGDHQEKNVGRRELGDHHVPVCLLRCGVSPDPRPLGTGERFRSCRTGTETAYRLEPSNCSVPLQRLETIGPMLIRDVAVDFALARAP